MKCKFCGTDLPEGSKFCPSCGAAVEQADNQNQFDQFDSSKSTEEKEQNNNQNPYGYGVPESRQENTYQYGNNASNENTYQYGYGRSGENQYTDYNNMNSTSYGQSQKPINGTLYLVLAILSTLLCCVPLGIVAIVYSSKINSLQKKGDYQGAQNAAKKAKLFTIIGVVIALVVSIFYIIFAVVLGISDSIDNSTVSNVVENVIDSKNGSEKVDAGDETEKDTKTVEPATASGELGANWSSYTVQINDKVLTFPCTKADVEAAGLTMDTEWTPENYMVNVDDYEMIYFQDGNENEIMAYAVNNTDKAIEVKDCIIGGISVSDYNLENGGMTVIFPGGIQIGASKDTVLNAYGDTNNTYEGDSSTMYNWYSDDSFYKSCEIDCDAETGLVISMNMQNFGQ